MAQFSYKDFSNKTQNTNNTRKVGYFSLKNDKDSAIVSFDYSEPSEFDLVTVHNVQQKDGHWRRISCLRENGLEPLDKCPLCASGDKVHTKFYVKLVQYELNEQGMVECKAKVWERPFKFTETLVNLMNEYGDLRKQLFTITRNGVSGSTDTTYDVMYANPMKYTADRGYTPNFDAFKDFDLSHHSYMVKSKEEIAEFMKTGEFPRVVRQQENYTTPNAHNEMAQIPAPMHTSAPQSNYDDKVIWGRTHTEQQPEIKEKNNSSWSVEATNFQQVDEQQKPTVQAYSSTPTVAQKPTSEVALDDPTMYRPRRVYGHNY